MLTISTLNGAQTRNTPFTASTLPQLIAAPFSPFKVDGSLHLDLVERYAEKLYRDGVSGVFVCGTSGEGMSLTQSERKTLAETWKTAVNGRMRFIVHVGHASLEEAKDLARHAQHIGADAIAAVGPTFFAPAQPSALVETCRQIAAVAPETPFYYYHMPSMSRVSFPAHTFFAEMAAAIPTFSGLKFTHEDLADYRKCLQLAGTRYEVFFGRDEMLLDSLKCGAKSAVGSTYNFAAPLYLKIASSYLAGNHAEAQKLQKLCTDAINIIVRLDGLVGIKATMKLAGIDCGSMRLPMREITQKECAKLEESLRDLGYFNVIAAAALG
jgi:N-acetylneuraminate lyase